MAERTWSGRREADRGRQMSGHAGGGRRGLSEREIPALYGAFLPQRVLCRAAFEGETGSEDAQGEPRPREQEGRERKGKAVIAELREMRLKEAAKKVEDGIEETLTYCDFPSEPWTRIRTNNVIERLNREIRRRTRVVGTFPDGNSALMLVCARLRHVAGTQWGSKKYMNMKHLEAAFCDASIA